MHYQAVYAPGDTGHRRRIRHGSASLQKEVVPSVLRGEKIAALAITEPGGGTDVSALRTTARRGSRRSAC